MTDAQIYYEMALEKCYEIERHPASEIQTMAVLVCAAALALSLKGDYVEGHINALHAAADFIISKANESEVSDQISRTMALREGYIIALQEYEHGLRGARELMEEAMERFP